EPSSVVRQVAVWIVTDDVTRSELDGRYVLRSSLFPLGGSPAASDEDVIYAIILVGESGIALTEKRIFTEKVSLVRALSSDNAMVRNYAMETLGVQSDRLLSYLVQVLQTGTAEIRRAAVYALGRLGDREAVEHIISALDDEEAGVRREAVHSLEQLEAVEGLIGALTNPDAQVRNAAVYALRDLGDPKAVEPLSGLLSDPEAYIRQSVCFALGDLGDPRAVPALIEALGDPDRYVRGAAVRALGKIGDARAIDPLKALLDSEPDEEVRQDIERSLERLQR
ncbi:MAG: HEAT repeat domain-containing protein, partial [Anaerolineales bacterium]|nr:HEAT repeat domain-containing protein [Anaerolineales bacterium]